MNIIIFQTVTVNPNEGGINRMSKVYFDYLTSNGYNVWFMSIEQGDRPILPRQLIAEGNTFVEQHDSFCQLIESHNIEVMIYQNGIAPYQNYILLWAKECNVKIIDVIHSTLRGMYSIYGHSLLSKIRPHFVKKFVNRIVNYYFIWKYGRCYHEQFELSDRVVLLSEKFYDEITYFTGWNDFSKFATIFNPLTLGVPQTISISSKKNTVLHVALLTEQKRQDLLLDIWKLVEIKRPDLTLKIVGDGYMRDRLKSKAQKLKLNNCEFLGFQTPQPYYNEASVFCLTSAYESFGLVLVEAMAFGCVPIAFNSFETVTDIISDGEDGILVSPFDVEVYAQKIIMLMEDNFRRMELAEKAVQKSKHFRTEIIMPKWIDLIESLKKS